MGDISNSELVDWKVRPNVNQQALYNLLECVMEIAQSLKSLANTWLPGTEAEVYVTAPLMVSCARRISTSIRKILLDGNGSLLKRCVIEPDFHPLRSPTDSTSINFLRHFGEQRFTLGWADGVSKEITVPSFSHTTTIYPLHGVRHIVGTKFEIYNPFDHDAEPVKFQKWMSTKVIEIDGYQFKAEQLLRDMSNKEGSHIEENHSLIVSDDLNIDRDKNTLHRLANGVKFGSLTYLQIFSLFTGLYIVNRTRDLLGELPFRDGTQAIEYICNEIIQSPKSIATDNGDVQFTSYPLAVLGHDRDLKGDYASGMRSTFRIPV